MTDPTVRLLQAVVDDVDASISPGFVARADAHRAKVAEAASRAGRVMVHAYCPDCSKRPKFQVVDSPQGPLVQTWFIPRGGHKNQTKADVMESGFLDEPTDLLNDPSREPMAHCAVHGELSVARDDLHAAVGRFRTTGKVQKVAGQRVTSPEP